MTPNETEIFERGKALFKTKELADNYQQALACFLEVVQLNPGNGLYHYWLGRSYYALDNYPNAVESFTKALQIDENKHYAAYFYRGNAYKELNEYELSLLDFARYYLIQKQQDNEQTISYRWENDPEPKFRIIYEHIKSNILPSLAHNDDTFVMYFPCWLQWDRKKDVSFYGGSSFSDTTVKSGTGYLLISRKEIFVASLGGISVSDPLYDKPGLGLKLLGALAHDKTKEIIEKQDQLWKITHSMVSRVQRDEHWIILTTPNLTWEFMPFSCDKSLVEAGLNLAMKNGFRNVGAPVETGSTGQKEDIVQLLQQLGELKEKGILSETEFEQKKKELLARL